MRFWWWDDALAIARLLAIGTHIRHRVTLDRATETWMVEPVMNVMEPCS